MIEFDHIVASNGETVRFDPSMFRIEQIYCVETGVQEATLVLNLSALSANFDFQQAVKDALRSALL